MSNLTKQNLILVVMGLIGYVVSSLVAPAEQVPALQPLGELQWTDRIASTKTSEGDEESMQKRSLMAAAILSSLASKAACERTTNFVGTRGRVVGRNDVVPGRNRPCPCGSGKKAKKCCE